VKAGSRNAYQRASVHELLLLYAGLMLQMTWHRKPTVTAALLHHYHPPALARGPVLLVCALPGSALLGFVAPACSLLGCLGLGFALVGQFFDEGVGDDQRLSFAGICSGYGHPTSKGELGQ
jgi:hypothetical protein